MNRIRMNIAGLLAALLLAVPCASRGNERAHTSPQATQQFSNVQMQRNNLALYVGNSGNFAYDISSFSNWGLRSIEHSAGMVFASGLWIGGKVDGGVSVAVSEYSTEFAPGSALGGMPEDPNFIQLRVHRLLRRYATTSARDLDREVWNNEALSRGAPSANILPDGSLDIPGDEVRWSVYNDLDINPHTSPIGHTLPLGVEVRHSTWAYDRGGVLQNTVFMRFQIQNRNPVPITEAWVGAWADPDLGDSIDDVTGSDSLRSMGFVWNATNNDVLILNPPPALGYLVLQSPTGTATDAATRPMRSFTSYTNGGDPANGLETYLLLQGRDRFGNVPRDPQNVSTRYMFAGDPVANTGWIDVGAGDKRMLLGSGPFNLAPGQIVDFVIAIVFDRGIDRFESVQKLQHAADQIRGAWPNNLPSLDAPDSAPRGLAIASVWPNPVRASLSLGITLPSSGRVELELLDVSGRVVATSSPGVLAPGRHTLSFDREVAQLAPGIYHARLRHSSGSVSRRVVVTR